ncbi:MAG: hypothetical protein KDA75_11315, partial [Planctomycetaceae bacterium]|nr:hypothetical protein [Planctomycetaceae bacterium]
ILRIQEILQTDRAVREQWGDRQSERFLSGASSIPPWIEVLVMGALVRPAVPEAAWSAALMQVPAGTELATLAGDSDASPEYLGRSPALRGARDALFLDVRPGLLGVMAPGYRQDAGRWSRQMSSRADPEISPILLEVAQRPEHIVLAMDLQDMLDPTRVRSRLEADDTLAREPSTRIRIATQLLRIRGIEMAITVGETIDSTVTISFNDDLMRQPAVFHKIFNSVLADMGLGIDEFDTAEPVIDGKTFTIRTPLAEESLRRILSIIVPPPPARPLAEAEPEPAAEAVQTPPKAARSAPLVTPREASRQYLLAVNHIIDDLKAANARAKTYARTATWHDNFARKIVNLSTIGVDQELIAYGTSVAGKLRAIAASLRGQEIDVSAQQSNLTYSYHSHPAWWSFNVWGGVDWGYGGYEVESNLQQVRQRQAEVVAAGAKDRLGVWQQIDDERARVETAMRQRYGDDFPGK